MSAILIEGATANALARPSASTNVASNDVSQARTLLAALRQHAADTPYKPALLVGRDQLWSQFTYRDLAAATLQWARRFGGQRLNPGSIVFIVLRHRHELYPAFLGAMRAGLVPSLLPVATPKQDPDLYWSSHAELFRGVRPRCILSEGVDRERITMLTRDIGCTVLDIDALARAPGVEPPPLADVEHPNRCALLQHSSGTTGLKKGIALSFDQIRRQIGACAAAVALTPADCIVSWLPLYHDMGLVASFLLPLTLGCMVVSVDAFEWLARPDWLLELIEQYRGTLCWLPNFAFNHLARTADPERRYGLSTIRAFVNCSEPCKPDTFAAFRAAFGGHGLRTNALQTCYAMAETVFAVTQSELRRSPRTLAVDAEVLATEGRIVQVPPDAPGALRFLSCGRPIPGIRLRIDAAPPDAAGEVQVAGEFVFSAYHANAGATEAAFRDGWYRTGDIGFVDDGELFVCGRKKELVIVHGRNYYANDIEEIVGTTPGVKPGRAVAFACYDEDTASEQAVVLLEAATVDATDWPELKRRVRRAVFDRLGLQLGVVEVRPPASLIKTTSGKLSRGENKKRFTCGRNRERPA